MSRFGIVYLFLSGILLMASCDSGFDCTKKSGSRMTEERVLEYFDRVEVHDLFRIYLKTDTLNKIVIETGQNLISEIKTSVTDSVLKIENKSYCRFVRGYGDLPKIILHCTNLAGIKVFEASDLYSIDTLKGSSIYFLFNADISTSDIIVDLSGQLRFNLWSDVTGNHVLKGKAGSFYSYSDGNAHVNAKELRVNEAAVTSVTTGDFHINARRLTEIKLYSSGNIFYTGTPEIIKVETRSSGRLIPENK